MAPKPFESRIQDLVYNVDVGIGLRLVKMGLYILFIFTVMLLYTATQFKGLKDAEAMDYAQLGRNVMIHKQFITQNVRPASMWYLIENSPEKNPHIDQHPDILHAPLYPVILATWFKMTGAKFPTAIEGVFQPEYNVIVLNLLFSLLTGILLYFLGRRLFDPKVALLGLSIYFLSDLVWRDSISGTGVSIVGFWTIAAIYAAVIAVSRLQDAPESKRWLVPASVALFFCVLAINTRYAAIALAPGIALYIGMAIKRRRWVWISGFIAIVLLSLAPWLARNVMTSGGLLGLAPYTALNDTNLFEENSFERSLAPKLEVSAVRTALQVKWLSTTKDFYQNKMRNLGEGLLVCFFLSAFFYRFVRAPVHWLRWCVALSFFLLVFIGGFFGAATLRLVHVFWPVVIIYGLAFFTLLLDRLQLKARVLTLSVTGAVVVMSALPMVLTFLPPRVGVPYPPYLPGFVGYVSNMLRSEELMCTDMPWATAWYGNRNSLLLPLTVEEFYDINDYTRRVSGLYFTPITRDQPYIRGLRSPRYASWFPILEGRIPGDFPLTQGIPLMNMEQIFLTDRARWLEQP